MLKTSLITSVTYSKQLSYVSDALGVNYCSVLKMVVINDDQVSLVEYRFWSSEQTNNVLIRKDMSKLWKGCVRFQEFLQLCHSIRHNIQKVRNELNGIVTKVLKNEHPSAAVADVRLSIGYTFVYLRQQSFLCI